MFSLYQKMPATWWNFFFYDKDQFSKDQVCEKLLELDQGHFLFNPCSPLFVEKEWLSSWAFDNIFSRPPPDNFQDLESTLNKTLVRMSLPQSADWLDIQSASPLADFSLIQKRFADFYQMTEEDNNWALLPVLFNYPPSQEDLTDQIEKNLNAELIAIGPHFGSIANKRLIKKDLNVVATIGLALFFLFFSYLFISQKKLFFLLLPGLFLSISFAAVIVIFTWGSIHGLTLAFGSGLIGISMDYAFHGWPERHKTQAWKSNSISFLTTFCAFALLSFFSIPLIKQLSIFALSGLTFSFIFTYIISLKVSDRLKPQALRLPVPKGHRTISYLSILILSLLCVFSFYKNRFDFSLVRMDSTQIKNKELLESSSQQMDKSQFAFLINSATDFSQLDDQYTWANQQSIDYLGPTSLRGENSQYEKNYALWLNFTCQDSFTKWNENLSPQLKNIFANFLTNISCESLKKYKSTDKYYLNLFIKEQKALSIFRIQSDEKKAIVTEKYPNTFFVSDITHTFPKKLRSEITYFVSFVFIVVFLILLFFLKSAAFYSFIPPIGAVSFAFTVHLILGHPLSFMSFVSLIILLGLTLDFGIFCTSCILSGKSLSKTFGSVSLSAITSLVGFAPLAFCAHPVLRDLGLTLFSGIIGAFFATFLIYPGLVKGKLYAR